MSVRYIGKIFYSRDLDYHDVNGGEVKLVIPPGGFEIIIYETIGAPNSSNMSNTISMKIPA